MHFGQKAKHVKTKVNVNEISQLNSSANQSVELDKANSVIAELKDRLRLFEVQMLAPPVPRPRSISACINPEEETKEGGLPLPSDTLMTD